MSISNMLFLGNSRGRHHPARILIKLLWYANVAYTRMITHRRALAIVCVRAREHVGGVWCPTAFMPQLCSDAYKYIYWFLNCNALRRVVEYADLCGWQWLRSRKIIQNGRLVFDQKLLLLSCTPSATTPNYSNFFSIYYSIFCNITEKNNPQMRLFHE